MTSNHMTLSDYEDKIREPENYIDDLEKDIGPAKNAKVNWHAIIKAAEEGKIEVLIRQAHAARQEKFLYTELERRVEALEKGPHFGKEANK